MPSEPARTVFFLSDFGSQDEFAGVVHAVIAARAPGTTVIDLTHHVPPFDVRAGSHTLVRAVPHLGSGVVLGVVDPGVGTVRRGIAMEVALPAGGTLYFVGPDNGLLVAAAEAAGEAPITRVVELVPRPTVGRIAAPPSTGATCSLPPRPRSAPARRWQQLGDSIDAASLVRLVGGVVEQGRLHDGRSCLRAEVTWVDHFGNLQLAATVADARASPAIPLVGSIELAARIESGREYLDGLPHSLVPDGVQLRCVDAFGQLKQGEFGLLVDANGHLAVVAGEASAAHWLNVVAGELLVLAW